MKSRSVLAMAVLLALVSGALAVPPGEQAGQVSMTGTIVQINPKGNLITVEPLSGAQLQTQQAVVKPGKKTGPVTALIDEQTAISGGTGKGKPLPGPVGKPTPSLGKQKPMPAQSKALAPESIEAATAPTAGLEMVEPREMVPPAEAIPPAEAVGPEEQVATNPGQPAMLPEGAAQTPGAGAGQGIAPPTLQGQTIGKPAGKQKPGKPIGKIASKLGQLQVGQLVQMTCVPISIPVGPAQMSPAQGKPGKPQPAQSQFLPADQTPPGKVKPGQVGPAQIGPEPAKLAEGGTGRGVAVELVEATTASSPAPAPEPAPGFSPGPLPAPSPAVKFRAVSIQILKAMDRPMPGPAMQPPAEPQPPAPPEPQPATPAAPGGPGGEL